MVNFVFLLFFLFQVTVQMNLTHKASIIISGMFIINAVRISGACFEGRKQTQHSETGISVAVTPSESRQLCVVINRGGKKAHGVKKSSFVVLCLCSWSEENFPRYYHWLKETAGPNMRRAWQATVELALYLVDAARPHYQWAVNKTQQGLVWVSQSFVCRTRVGVGGSAVVTNVSIKRVGLGGSAIVC